MKVEEIALLLNSIAQCSEGESVAKACSDFLCDYNSKNSSDKELSAAPLVQVSQREEIRANYLAMVDRLCIVLKPHIGDGTSKVRLAMTSVFDNDKTGRWFKPRHCNEKFNIEKSCRVIYYLYINRFLVNIDPKGKNLNIKSIVNILIENPVLESDTKSFSTLKCYFCRNTDVKPFELFCRDLSPSNYA